MFKRRSEPRGLNISTNGCTITLSACYNINKAKTRERRFLGTVETR